MAFKLTKAEKQAGIQEIQSSMNYQNYPLLDTYIDNLTVSEKNKYLMKSCLKHILVSNSEEITFILNEYPKLFDLLNENVSDVIDDYSNNIMHYVCKSCNYENYLRFIETYSYLMNKQNMVACFPIMKCCSSKKYNKEEAEKIILHYFDLCHPIEPVILSSMCSNELCVRDFFTMIVAPLQSNTFFLSTALRNSSKYITIVQFKHLLELGLDIDCERNKTIAHFFLWGKRHDLFETMIEAGLIIDEMLLYYVSSNRWKPEEKKGIFEFIIENYDNYTFDLNKNFNDDVEYNLVQILLLRSDDSAILMFLLDRPELDVKCLTKQGETLLHLLYRSRNYSECRIEIAKKMIQLGVDINAKSNLGYYFYDTSNSINFKDIFFFEEAGIKFTIDDSTPHLYYIVKDSLFIESDDDNFRRGYSMLCGQYCSNQRNLIIDTLNKFIERFIIDVATSSITISNNLDDDPWQAISFTFAYKSIVVNRLMILIKEYDMIFSDIIMSFI